MKINLTRIIVVLLIIVCLLVTSACTVCGGDNNNTDGDNIDNQSVHISLGANHSFAIDS
ncbi:MAG: hypothetical protein PHW00_01845 [Clostridia bacterium]|nr:hypothetical protein [Clostridia bacterium]